MVPRCQEIALWAISYTTRTGHVGLILCTRHARKVDASCARRVDVDGVHVRRRLDSRRLDWLRARCTDQGITIPIIKSTIRDREVGQNAPRPQTDVARWP